MIAGGRDPDTQNIQWWWCMQMAIPRTVSSQELRWDNAACGTKANISSSLKIFNKKWIPHFLLLTLNESEINSLDSHRQNPRTPWFKCRDSFKWHQLKTDILVKGHWACELRLNGCESDVCAKNQIIQVRGHQQCHLARWHSCYFLSYSVSD